MANDDPAPRGGHEYGERRAALIEATIQLVAREGIRNLSYRAVAREAGVAHPLIAHHFGSLDTLLDAAMNHSLAVTTRELLITAEAGDHTSFARGFPSGVERLSDTLKFQYHVMVEGRGPESEQRLAHVHEIYRDAIGDALLEIGCPDTVGLVEVVYAALEGIVFHQIMRSGRERNELALAHLRIMLGAFRPPHSTPGESP